MWISNGIMLDRINLDVSIIELLLKYNTSASVFFLLFYILNVVVYVSSVKHIFKQLWLLNEILE